MTVIGHLTSIGVTAGTAGLISARAAVRLIAYYVVVMAAFIIWTRVADPRSLGALYIDWTGNLGGLLFVYLYGASRWRGERLFIAALIGSQLLAGFSHPFDFVLLRLTGHIPDGMWRPQHFWHTPLFALSYCALVSPLVARLLKLDLRTAFIGLALGYGVHIACDTITYDFPIYWAWPFTDRSAFSFETAFRPVCDGTYTTFGSVLYWFGDAANTPTGLATYNPKWSWVIYWAEPLVNVLLAALFCLVAAARRTGLAHVERDASASG